MPKRQAAEQPSPPSFEEALARLQDVVARLESGQLTLDESVRLFQEGTELARVCSARLDDAEQRIDRLVQAAGQVRLEPFEARQLKEEGA